MQRPRQENELSITEHWEESWNELEKGRRRRRYREVLSAQNLQGLRGNRKKLTLSFKI